MAFSPDGRYGLSGSHDGTVRLWDLEAGKELSRLISFSKGDWAMVKLDGHFEGSPNGMKRMRWVVGMGYIDRDPLKDTGQAGVDAEAAGAKR